MSELFNEVDEELRRERLKKLWDKCSIYIVSVALLIVVWVGAWRGYAYYQANKAAEVGAAFTAAAELAEQNKHAEAEIAFDKIASSGCAGYRTLARLRAAAELMASDPQTAVKRYDEIAADRRLAAPFRELAGIRAASLLLETASYNDLRQRLEPGACGTCAFRHTARELLALSAWRANNMTATRYWIDKIISDVETPGSLHNRANVLQALLPPTPKEELM